MKSPVVPLGRHGFCRAGVAAGAATLDRSREETRGGSAHSRGSRVTLVSTHGASSDPPGDPGRRRRTEAERLSWKTRGDDRSKSMPPRVCAIVAYAPRAPLAQWIEHQTSDLRVGGSSPSGRTTVSSHPSRAHRSLRGKNCPAAKADQRSKSVRIFGESPPLRTSNPNESGLAAIARIFRSG